MLLDFTGFYWVLLVFTGFELSFVVSFRVFRVSIGFGFGFTVFYRVLLGFTRFYWVLQGFTGCYWVLLDLTGFELSFVVSFRVFRVSIGFGFGFTMFYWV